MTIYENDDDETYMPRNVSETADSSETEDRVTQDGDASASSEETEKHGHSVHEYVDGDVTDYSSDSSQPDSREVPAAERSPASRPEDRDDGHSPAQGAGRSGHDDSDRQARHRHGGHGHVRRMKELRGGRGMLQAGRYESSSERRERKRREMARNIVGSELYEVRNAD